MQIDTQTYKVTLTFEYTEKVFEGDPDDRFELAKYEQQDIEDLILNHFNDTEIKNIKVEPVITPGK